MNNLNVKSFAATVWPRAMFLQPRAASRLFGYYFLPVTAALKTWRYIAIGAKKLEIFLKV
jgi:hypothetical protein